MTKLLSIISNLQTHHYHLKLDFHNVENIQEASN